MLSNFFEIIFFFMVKYVKHKLGHFNNFELHISGVLIIFSMCN